jgi:EAL domain-containing protein (putative c-di-GMP-specific phosphodiesterase class I)
MQGFLFSRPLPLNDLERLLWSDSEAGAAAEIFAA